MNQASARPGQTGDREQRLTDRRLSAAVILALRVEVAEALLRGIRVPARRLDAEIVQGLGLRGGVRLDERLALAVVAFGPLAGPSPPPTPRRRAP